MADYEPPDPGTILKMIDLYGVAYDADAKLRAKIAQMTPETCTDETFRSELNTLAAESQVAHAAAKTQADKIQAAYPPRQ